MIPPMQMNALPWRSSNPRFPDAAFKARGCVATTLHGIADLPACLRRENIYLASCRRLEVSNRPKRGSSLISIRHRYYTVLIHITNYVLLWVPVLELMQSQMTYPSSDSRSCATWVEGVFLFLSSYPLPPPGVRPTARSLMPIYSRSDDCDLPPNHLHEPLVPFFPLRLELEFLWNLVLTLPTVNDRL